MNFRKGFLTLAIVVMVMAMAGSAFALWEAPNKQVETYIVSNTSTTAYAVEAVSTTSGGSGGEGINPKYHRILGIAIVPANTSKGSEFFATLYDETAALTATYIFDEVELGATNDKAPRMYPYPKKLVRGLTVWMGMNVRVIIYYEDIRKI